MPLQHVLRLLLLIAATTLSAVFSEAATIESITAQSDEDCNFRLSGEIRDGDLDKIKALEKALWGQRLCLSSPGGSYSEGLRIAKHFISNMLITTVVDHGAECYSACALIFMAGHGHITRQEFPSRFLHVGGKLAFHSPFPDWSALPNTTFSKSDVKTFYDAAMRASQQLINIFSTTGHNGDTPDKATWIKPSLISLILATPSDQLLYVDTVGKAGNWQIELFGNKRIGRLNENLARQACVNSWYWHGDVHTVMAATDKANGSVVEATLLRTEPAADGGIQFVMQMADGGTGPECIIKSLPAGEFWHGSFKQEGWYDRAFTVSSIALFPLDTPLRNLLSTPNRRPNADVRTPPVQTKVASTPSFDCQTARAATEQAICGDAILVDLDNRLSRLYVRLLEQMDPAERTELALKQREWLRNRNACDANAQCIGEQYRSRIKLLQAVR